MLVRLQLFVQHEPFSAGVHYIDDNRLQAKRFGIPSVDDGLVTFLGVGLIDEVCDVREYTAVGHVVPADDDER